MDLRHLRYFVAIAEEQHMTRAAERLGLQQPPLSQQIKALEVQLGVELLIRHPRGVNLTDAGRVFFERAQRILADARDLQTQMQRMGTGIIGTVKLGFTASAGVNAFVPAALRVCRERCPEIDLVVNETADILDAIREDQLDCGLLRFPAGEYDKIIVSTLLREPVVVALPSGHRLLQGARQRPTIRLEDLRDETFVLNRPPGTPGPTAALLAACEALGFRPHVAVYAERLLTSINLVAAGNGVAVVPISMAGVHAQAVVFCPLHRSSNLDMPLNMAHRSATAPALSQIIALLKEFARDWPNKDSS